MPIQIRRAAVLGAGVMGAQIAAHLAAAGVRTYLLDLPMTEPPKDPALAKALGARFRSGRALQAIEVLQKLKPSPIAGGHVLANIIPGNFDDDMSVIAEADWIIEVVAEKLEIKKSIHKRIAEYARPGVPVTTNTSGIPLRDISSELSEEYQKSFFGTHFFNPPRYMHLMEIIPGAATDHCLVEDLSSWIEERLGKGTVLARDTVNFIGNRIGVFSMASTLRHMESLKLNIETVDALTGKLIGRPSSATLRTADVVGLDVMAHVSQNVYRQVSKDPYRDLFQTPSWIQDLIDKGALGQKTDSTGCYKKSKDAKGATVILAYRPDAKTYEEQKPAQFPWAAEASGIHNLFDRLKFILKQKDAGAELIWRSLRDTFSYSALLLNEIAGGQPKLVDDAIRWGFNWEYGPFEIWQGLGFDQVLERMREENVKLPDWIKPGIKFYDPAPDSPEWTTQKERKQWHSEKTKFVDIVQPAHRMFLPKSAGLQDPRVVAGNKSASLLDIGDGAACLVFHSKLNTIDADLIEMLQRSVGIVASKFRALVIGNESENFCAGANLKMLLQLSQAGDFKGIDTVLRQFQGAMQMIKFAPFPVVSCPRGLTLGGGCEIALQTSFRVNALETYTGLVEAGVGLIPAGGGTKELALRAYNTTKMTERGDPMAFLQRAFLLIGMAEVSSSGFECIERGLFPHTTSVCMSNDHQILKAKEQALHMADQGYLPASPATKIAVVGDPGIQTFKLMLYNMLEGRQISAHDALIGEKVATVLCGGEIDGGQMVSEEYLLDLERRVFVELCREPKTVERIQHMLTKGKPLRN